MEIKNLSSLSGEELKAFLDSFDGVFCDCDGVIVQMLTKAVPGTPESYNLLKNLGKDFRLVSNNCTTTIKQWQKKMQNLGFTVEMEDLVNPMCAILSYLKSINFNKELFVIGFSGFKEELREAGFKVAESAPDRIDESVHAFMKTLEDNENIGAVIHDFDFNLNLLSIYKITVYLLRPDVLYITGASDEKLALAKVPIIGPGPFHNLIKNFTGRKSINFGKPHKHLNDYIVKKYNITNPSRILFIGDSLAQDMCFGTNHGYQKLLVLTGITTLKDLENLKEGERPDYYIDSLGDLHKVIMEKLPQLCPLKL